VRRVPWEASRLRNGAAGEPMISSKERFSSMITIRRG
jgi:hypothetical protein